ncbi:TPA: hypothetical protein U5E23_004190, partial [Yersinia enterocolitica]|nr:hypothetical protein [Yersinia enterocolitica]
TQEEYYPFGGTALFASRNTLEAKYKTVRYSGKERDASGLYYYGFRYYLPWLGRWLSADPAGTIDGLNLYRMVRNNPISLMDEDGNVGESFMKLLRKKTPSPQFEIPKNIHHIWIGTRNISDQNIAKTKKTAELNPNYNTYVIYDSGIKDSSNSINYLKSSFSGTSIKPIDIREKGYFNEFNKSEVFKYYQSVLNEGKYAQASDILRLSILKNEGGIYKDIDDIQIKGFGNLEFQEGIGVMLEYEKSADKDSAIPNTPIATTAGHPIIIDTLQSVLENYNRGERNILKLAGPDVFTESVYKIIPNMNAKILSKTIKETVKQKGKYPTEKDIEKIKKISEPYRKMKGLAKYVTNGADHSWC